MVNVLYIHGMGGGGDSRIPSILNDALSARGVRIIVHTYDFDPEIAHVQIEKWVNIYRPSLVIGESLGAIHAIRVRNIPHLLISPAINAPIHLGRIFCPLSLIPGMTMLLDRIYRPREGDRQILHFSYGILRKYIAHRREAMKNTPRTGSHDSFHAFIGTRDHYRKFGVVSIRAWKRHFGDTCTLYDGTHYTEDEFIHSLIVPEICNALDIK